jgi:hypothetical protein
VLSPLAAGIAPGVVVALIVGTSVLVIDVHRFPGVDQAGGTIVGVVGIAGISVVSAAGHCFLLDMIL